MKNKKGFTLIELLIVVSVIAILATVILVSINESRKKARINGVKSSLKGAVTAAITCSLNNSAVNVPLGQEDGSRSICASSPEAKWPMLPEGYSYVAGGIYGNDCNFSIFTNGDLSVPLNCLCSTQVCK